MATSSGFSASCPPLQPSPEGTVLPRLHRHTKGHQPGLSSLLLPIYFPPLSYQLVIQNPFRVISPT